MAQLNISLSDEALEAIRKEAKARGQTVSEYVRFRAAPSWPVEGFADDMPTRQEFDDLSQRVQTIESAAERAGAL